jgi:hypothetical protein
MKEATYRTVFKSDIRTIHCEDEEINDCQYYLEVEEFGEHSDPDTPYVVWQVDLDDKGKPWNSTPCVAKLTKQQCIDWIEENI